jgi:NADH-quinone oxidoreductase subunit H
VGVTQKDKSPGSEATFWLGTVEAPVRLSFFQPSMRNLADQIVAWISDGRMLGWLGLQVEATGQSLKVVGLEPGDRSGSSLASSAGLQVGDKIERAAGKPVKSAADLTLAFRQTSRRGKVALGVKRGDRELSVDIAPRDKPFIVPSSVIDLAVMVIFGLVALTVALVISGTLTWFERRVAGRMQSRVGPNRVGPFGFLQWVADGVKLLLKEDIIPDAVDRPLFKLAPYLVFMGLLGTFVVLPFGQYLIIADLNVGLIYLIAITGFVSLGLMMAGWSSNNKWALLGGMRSAAQIISYEIPTGLALMVPVVLAGTLSTQTLVERQGGLPWQWNVFDNPFIFGCFIIYFVSALAEGNRTPFDLPEAESELVAGYNIEYSGWRFAVFFLSEWANLFVVGAVATTVFLGGWRVPWVTLAEQASHWYLQLFGLFLFFAKAMTLVFVIIWIRWTLPRFRVDQMMGLCWKYFVPWTFAALIFQAFWVWVAPPAARSVVHAFTFVICGLGLLVLFFSRVYYNWRMNPEEFSWKQLY